MVESVTESNSVGIYPLRNAANRSLDKRGFMRMEHRVRSRSAVKLVALEEGRVEGPTEVPARAARDMALDINTAQLPRLKSLTGIGEHYAKRIVEGRPYRDRDELLTRHILPHYIYGRIMERFCVRQPSRVQVIAPSSET
jgi:hypothetical protein